MDTPPAPNVQQALSFFMVADITRSLGFYNRPHFKLLPLCPKEPGIQTEKEWGALKRLGNNVIPIESYTYEK